MQQVVTLVEYSVPKTGTSQHGAWSLHVFKDAGGNSYQTFKDDVANLGRSLLNQPVTVTYDVEVKNGTNPQTGAPTQFTNNKLTSIEAAYGQQPVAQPQAQPQQALPPQQPAQAPPVAQQSYDAKQSVINRSAALARAIETCAAGIVTGVNDPHQLLPLADIYVRYIEGGSAAFTNAVPSHGDPGAAANAAATSGPQY